MKYFRLGESEELIKEAWGIDIDNNKKQNSKKIEKIRKELEKYVKSILSEDVRKLSFA